MELSPKQAHCLKQIHKAINKWKYAGQNNKENSKVALSLGVKAMKIITENLELLMACFDKFGGELQTRNALNQHLAMVDGMRKNNDLDFENMGGYYDYQSFAQDHFTSAINTWIDRLEEIPEDLITLEVAVADYLVSRSTLKRHIKAKTIKSYRPKKSPNNAKHIIRRTDIEHFYQRKRS